MRITSTPPEYPAMISRCRPRRAMIPWERLARWSLTALVVSATVCACSSSSTQHTAPATTASALPHNGESGPESTTATDGEKAAPVALCVVLPISQVASLSGKALTSSRELDSAGINSYQCAYYTASGVGGLSVTLTAAGGLTAYNNSLQNDTIEGSAEHVMPLTGIGDKAFSARDGVRALFGNHMIYVAGLTSVEPAKAVIEALQAKIK